MTPKLPLLVAALVIAATIPAKAELPPTAYEQFKKEAPEILRIQITAVTNEPGTTSESMENRTITAKAKVLYTRRSKAGIRPGDTITLSYGRSTPKVSGWAGPAPVPVVEKGTIYRAYLQSAGTGKNLTFAPAAKGQSFEVIPPAELAPAKPKP